VKLDFDKIAMIQQQLRLSNNIKDYRKIQNAQLPDVKRKKWGNKRPQQEKKRVKKEVEHVDQLVDLVPEDYRLTDMIITAENNKLFAEEQTERLEDLDRKLTQLTTSLNDFQEQVQVTLDDFREYLESRAYLQPQ